MSASVSPVEPAPARPPGRLVQDDFAFGRKRAFRRLGQSRADTSRPETVHTSEYGSAIRQDRRMRRLVANSQAFAGRPGGSAVAAHKAQDVEISLRNRVIHPRECVSSSIGRDNGALVTMEVAPRRISAHALALVPGCPPMGGDQQGY